MNLQILFFLFAFNVSFISMRYFIVGPADLRVSSMKNCPEYKNLPVKMQVEPYMYNKTTQLFNVDVFLPADLDNNVTIDLKCSRIDDAKKQVNSFVINNTPMMPTLNRYLGEFWADLRKQLGITAEDTIKKGNYSNKEIFVDLQKLNVQMFLEGNFMTKLLFRNNSKPIYCSNINFALFPKKNNK